MIQSLRPSRFIWMAPAPLTCSQESGLCARSMKKSVIQADHLLLTEKDSLTHCPTWSNLSATGLAEYLKLEARTGWVCLPDLQTIVGDVVNSVRIDDFAES